MIRNQKGFSLIELLIVMLIIGTLAGIALPNLQRALLRARAVDAMGSLNSVRVAVLNYQAEEGVWPTDVNRGIIPSGLEPYLPEGFTFNQDDYVIDYDEWTDGVGLVGLTLITEDRELGLMLMDLLGGNTWTDGNQKYTWVLEWTA